MSLNVIDSFHALEDTICSPKFKTPEKLLLPECNGTTFSRFVANLQSDPDPLFAFQRYAESVAFQEFVGQFGLQNPSFARNPHAVPGKTLHAEFLKVLRGADVSGSGVAIVFHGTEPPNIDNILQNGLDPSRRRGQTYGPGEYFSKAPTASVSYCAGGLSMLVFAVIVPKIQQNDAHLPENYVVVPDNAHQIPLGTVSFTSVDYETLLQSDRMRAALQKQAAAQQTLLEETQYRALICQLLIQNTVDLAQRKYEKAVPILTENSRRLISYHVHQVVDAELVEFLFPGLPPPPLLGESGWDDGLKSLEEQEKEAQEAFVKLGEQKMPSQKTHIQ